MSIFILNPLLLTSFPFFFSPEKAAQKANSSAAGESKEAASEDTGEAAEVDVEDSDDDEKQKRLTKWKRLT